MKYTLSLLLGFSCCFLLSQSFSSHTVMLTPAENHAFFNDEALRIVLLKKYSPKFQSVSRLTEFTEEIIDTRRKLARTNHIYDNWPQATAYLRKLFWVAVPESAADTNIKLHLVRDPELNASMSPDGTLLLNVGAIASLRSEAELIALLGHEYGHYSSDHGYKNYNRLVEANNRNRNARHFGLYGAAFMIVNTSSAYERIQENEREADLTGVKIFRRISLHPMAMQSLYQRFIREDEKHRMSQFSRRPLIYFSTHPSPEKRVEYCRSAFGEEWVLGGDHFVLDSALFQTIRRQAIDECIYLRFEEKDYTGCLEKSFEQHLLYPADEFYKFFIVECLRREIALSPGFASDLFITGNYRLSKTAGTPTSSMPAKVITTNTHAIQYENTVFYHLRSPIFNLSEGDLNGALAKNLLDTDTIEFITNEDALKYFASNLNPSCGAHLFSLLCLKQHSGSGTGIEPDSELEKRYLSARPDSTLITDDRLFVFPGLISVWSMKGNRDELGWAQEAKFRSHYYEYLDDKFSSDSIDFGPPLAFHHRYIAWGSLLKARKLKYRNGIGVIEKCDLREIDPELYSIAKQYGTAKFAVIDFEVETERYGQIGTKPKRWKYTIYMIDFKANRFVKKNITQNGRVKDTELALFGKVAKEVELLKKGVLR